MKPSKKVAVVIAAYNEGSVIQETCSNLKITLPSCDVIVVNDGSTDNTHTVLKEISVVTLNHPINLGQGAALQTGISYANKEGYEYIITYDADGQHSAIDAQSMLQHIQANPEIDVVLGSRFLRIEDIQKVPRIKQRLLKLATFFTTWTTGLKLTDTHNGLRVLGPKAIQSINLKENGMTHASEFLEQVAKLKLNYIEMPTTIIYTEYSMKKGQKLSNSLNILWDLFTKRMK